MKTRLNLTIDDGLLNNMKIHAQKQGTSISELVENYFREIAKPKKKKKNILQLVEDLKAPSISTQADLKELFYKEQSSKHGF
ncbi:MAG TPA: DUF6364 family protein [Hanamia sp.]